MLVMAKNEETVEPTDDFPNTGRLIGIDYGTVRIGIAICDASQSICSPFETYYRKTLQKDGEYFQRMIKEEQVVGLVIGLPVHASGDDSKKSIEAKGFAKWLQKVTELPIKMFDERYTSLLADQLMGVANLTKKQRKARLDKIAAQMILSGFLESARNDESPRPIED